MKSEPKSVMAIADVGAKMCWIEINNWPVNYCVLFNPEKLLGRVEPSTICL